MMYHATTILVARFAIFNRIPGTFRGARAYGSSRGDTMKVQTRRVLLGGGVLVLGLATGLVGDVPGGGPALAMTQSGPDELQYIPGDATVVAFVDLREVMLSDFRQQLRAIVPELAGPPEFRDQTGIDLENDIDRVVAGFLPQAGGGDPEALVVLRGRFDTTRLEGLARQHGGTVEDYSGVRLVKIATDANELALAFVEPGLIAVGSDASVRRAIDLPATGGDVTSNARLMDLLGQIEAGSNAWAIGRFDEPDALAWLPDAVASLLSQVTAFAAGGRVNGGVSGTINLEARDEQVGQDLRDVIQAFIALARLQTSSQPELSGVIDSFQLGGVGTSVSLSFALPPDFLELATPSR